MPWLQLPLLRRAEATQYLVHSGDVVSLHSRLGRSGMERTSRYVHLAAEPAATIEQRVAPMGKIEVRPMKVPKEQ
jgi:hypothetical protein